MKLYSFKKCKHILRQTYHLFQKRKKVLSTEEKSSIQGALIALQDAILDKNKTEATRLAQVVGDLQRSCLKKPLWMQFKDLVFGLGFALVVAIVVRQMWFEFYEIPSGSMRPTFKEQDRLSVSKTAFGINIPLTPREFYFEPDLVKRNGIVIFTGEDMDIRDVDTLYFYLFPGKKQYVKRLIGKPGDILYFYGGQIFGIDKEGHDISSELQLSELSDIDHIPFIDFERKVVFPPHPVGGIYAPVFIYQMNTPVAKLSVAGQHKVTGEMLPLQGIHDPKAPPVTSYADLWGLGHFATARLLTKSQVGGTADTSFYLELKHNPNFYQAHLVQDEMGHVRPALGLSTSLIPLEEEDLKTLLSHLYTARFVVKNGVAYRYGASASNPFAVKMPLIPNGCYEFIGGIAYEVVWQGITKELPKTHPLYAFEVSQIQQLFNLGMEWDTRFSPDNKRFHLTPARYAYFRNGALYVMGQPLMKKGNPQLEAFVDSELKKQEEQTQYRAFVDRGSPINSEGKLDKAVIEQNGLLIPEGHYLVLGDNHAMSADSREFGFVPAGNLRGAPEFIFWPPGSRWGFPNQPDYPFFNLPRTIVWGLAAIGIGFSTIYWRRRNSLPLRFED